MTAPWAPVRRTDGVARAAWIIADIAVVLAYTGWLGVICGLV